MIGDMTMAEVGLNNLSCAKEWLVWYTQPYYTREEFFSRLRNAEAEYNTQWLIKFGCSWCGDRATHNLNTVDMCCDKHYLQYFTE